MVPASPKASSEEQANMETRENIVEKHGRCLKRQRAKSSIPLQTDAGRGSRVASSLSLNALGHPHTRPSAFTLLGRNLPARPMRELCDSGLESWFCQLTAPGSWRKPLVGERSQVEGVLIGRCTAAGVPGSALPGHAGLRVCC